MVRHVLFPVRLSLPGVLPVLALLLGLGLRGAGAAPPQDEHAGWFPFVVPDLAGDETVGSLLDLSFLNPEPAGAHGFLRPQGEDLADDRGDPIRLFGSNITDYHPMPPKETAPRVAERLRQLGINFIRLHYFDWDEAPRGILNPDRQTLNPEKLDQLDFLIAQLKRCGIYVDINLHVARGYVEMPSGWDRMGKGIDLLHKPYIESQKRYARELLTHVNPYTRTAYVSEPAVAVIELNNENTALRDWEAYAGLPERFAGPLRVRWNAWLRDRYRDTAGLRAAWNADAPRGPNLLRNADLAGGAAEWVVQNSGGAESTLTAQRDEAGAPLLRWEATKAGTQFWHLQAMQTEVPVKHGTRCVVAFRARAQAPATLEVSLMQQQEPWATVGRGVRFRLGREWRQCAAAWVAENPAAIPTRLNFTCGNQTGTIEVAGLSLREGGVAGLGEGESIEAGSVPLVADTASAARTEDYLRFLMDEELHYVREMRRFVKEELGAKSLLFDTQVTYGGLAGLRREAKTGDAVDCHAYPDHPRRESADGKTVWAVRNVSMVDGAFGGLEGLALNRAAGKPYFVTEFDLNPPNDHAAETFPLLALMAAYQGWSGIADYAWYNFQQEYGHTRIRSHFATTGHAGQMAFVPMAALLFRQGLVAPAKRRAVLSVPEGSIARELSGDTWFGTPKLWARHGATAGTAWRCSLAARLTPGAGLSQAEGRPAAAEGRPAAAEGRPAAAEGRPAAAEGRPAAAEGRPVAEDVLESDTGQIHFDRTVKGREHLRVNAPACRMLVGRVAGRAFDLGDVRVEVAAGTFRDYANVALVALDGRPVAQSRKLLLTAVARVENKGQQWNAARTSIGANWGEGPTLAEPLRLTVTLPGAGWRARALDGGGRPRADVPLPAATLRTGPEHETLWYLIER